jgi:HK97 family phage prohead protease
MNKYASITDIKSTNTKERIVEFVASKEITDYDNEVVMVDGIDISKIKKNKSFLWSHNMSLPPIGKIININKDGKILKGKAQMTSEAENPFGYTIYKLIHGGYINNVSIGFIPDYETMTYKEDKKTGKQIRVINNSTLLEVSAVNIGSNSATTISAKSLTDMADKAYSDNIIDIEELDNFKYFIPAEEKILENTDKVVELEQKVKELEDEVIKSKEKLEKMNLKVSDEDEESIYKDLFEMFDDNDEETLDDLIEEIL